MLYLTENNFIIFIISTVIILTIFIGGYKYTDIFLNALDHPGNVNRAKLSTILQGAMINIVIIYIVLYVSGSYSVERTWLFPVMASFVYGSFIVKPFCMVMKYKFSSKTIMLASCGYCIITIITLVCLFI